MTRDEAKAIISDLIEWYTEDLGERLGLNMCAETYMDALEVLWHGPEGELISRADAIAFINSGISLDTDADREYATEMLKNIPSAEAPTTDEKHQLSSETPTNAPTDLISRADAIEAVRAESRKVYTSEYANAERIIYEADAVEALAMLPSAEAVQGEWKRVETRTYKGECSNCGFRHIFMDGHDSQYRFCPYCGARMTPCKGGEDE